LLLRFAALHACLKSPHRIPWKQLILPLGAYNVRDAMQGTREPRAIFFLIVVCAAALAFRDYPLVPDQMASHFDIMGAANGWMSKPAFFVFYATMIAVAFGVEFFVPRSIATRSTARINLPNKEYWLAPKQRVETLNYLKRQFAWYGCAFLGLEVCAMEIATRANLKAQPTLPVSPVLFLLGAFLAFNVLWMLHIYRRFAKPA
jgi:uncharacterized membrane protein